MLEALEVLRQLQALDSQIDAERVRVSTIDALLHDRSEYEAAKQRHDVTTAPLRQLEADQMDLELKVGSARSQLVEADQKLYSGKVSNSRELADLQSRGTDLRRQIESGDDTLLDVMERLETARADAATADAELRRVVTARRTLETDLVAERKALVASIRATTAARDQARTAIDPANVRTYDRLRVRHGGAVVVGVKQRICLGCRVTLTGAYEQRLRQGGTLVSCQSCGRFLYIAS